MGRASQAGTYWSRGLPEGIGRVPTRSESLLEPLAFGLEDPRVTREGGTDTSKRTVLFFALRHVHHRLTP